MKLIESKTLGTAQASIEFTSIPQTFTDLVLVVSGRSDRNTGGWCYVHLQFNDTTSGYTTRSLLGTGSSVSSYDQSGLSTGGSAIVFGGVAQANNTSNTFGNTSAYIPNYTGSTNKSLSGDGVGENNATDSPQQITAGLWSNTAAITKITIKPWQSPDFFNWVSGTTVSLYGVLKGSDGIVTTS
jgi:hypothetical protein